MWLVFISPKKCTIEGNIIPKSVKCIHSATQFRVTNLWGVGLQDIRCRGQLMEFVEICSTSILHGLHTAERDSGFFG